MANLANRKYAIEQTLGESAGEDIRQDTLHVGYIKALNDLLGIEYHETQEWLSRAAIGF